MREFSTVRVDPGAYERPEPVFGPTIGEASDNLAAKLDAVAKAAQERAGIEPGGIEGKADDGEAT